MSNGKGSQLAQLRPSGTTAVTALSNVSANTEITTIIVCNVNGSGADFSLYHDNDGTTFDETTALFKDVTVPHKGTEIITFGSPSAGITLLRNNGAIGVKSSVASGLTFTFYGVVGTTHAESAPPAARR